MTERLVNLTDESWSGVDPVPVGVPLIDVKPVDLERETVGGTGLSLPTGRQVPEEGWTRNILAILFASTIPLIIVASYLGLLTERANVQAVKDLSTALLGPVIGIVGAVVGFYFSERQRRGQ
ncbi:MAG: hypothetical protein QOE72_3544 [Chloroflexota bacterium]|jgi:hypothetical protein|nr:hypothetical protein [Chloroflexota bacterium]